MSAALTSLCHHCSAKYKLPFFNSKNKQLNKHGKKMLPPRNSRNVQFYLLLLPHGVSFQHLTTGIFYLLCSSLENTYLEMLPFKSMPWYPYYWACCFCSRSVHILHLYALSWQIIGLSIQQYSGVGKGWVGWGGRGLPTDLASLVKAPFLRSSPDLASVSTVMKISIKPPFWMV